MNSLQWKTIQQLKEYLKKILATDKSYWFILNKELTSIISKLENTKSVSYQTKDGIKASLIKLLNDLNSVLTQPSNKLLSAQNLFTDTKNEKILNGFINQDGKLINKFTNGNEQLFKRDDSLVNETNKLNSQIKNEKINGNSNGSSVNNSQNQILNNLRYKLPEVLAALVLKFEASQLKIKEIYGGKERHRVSKKTVVPEMIVDGSVPKWKVKSPAVSKESIMARTNHIISLINSAQTEISLLKRLDALLEHLKQYPKTKNHAIKIGALNSLLRMREQISSKRKAEELIENKTYLALREALARLGYVDPLQKRGIRILSIDGGGMRGVLVIEMLKRLETLTGMRAYEMFDYVCGVSTGAILIAAIICNRQSLDEALANYKELSKKIFNQNPFLGTSSLVWNHAYYDTEQWEKLLQEYSGPKSMISTARDPKCPKFSTVSVIVNEGATTTPFVFRNYSLPYRVQSAYMGGAIDNAVWQAVRASAAAPTYFEEFRLNDQLHQDGGIMVNNPTAIAIHEAKQLWPKAELQCVVSFGTGRTHPNFSIDDDVEPENNSSGSSWKNKFLKILDGATDTEGVHNMLNDLLPPNVYYRFNPYITEMLSIVEIRPEKIAQLEKDALMYLRRNEEKFEEAAKSLMAKRTLNQKLNDFIDKQLIINNLKKYKY